MSYILDALRRAEAERERGRVPGLHTQALPVPGEPVVPRARRAGSWAGGILALLGAAALGAWWALREPAPEPVAPAMPRPAPAVAPPAPVATPPLQLPPIAVPPPSVASPAAPRRPAAPLAEQATPTAAEPVPPPAGRPIALAALSAQQRAELPPLAIGGLIYSPSAASRFILINGQVVREGEAAAPGVTLERIGPKGAVLRWRELRIEVPQ